MRLIKGLLSGPTGPTTCAAVRTEFDKKHTTRAHDLPFRERFSLGESLLQRSTCRPLRSGADTFRQYVPTSTRADCCERSKCQSASSPRKAPRMSMREAIIRRVRGTFNGESERSGRRSRSPGINRRKPTGTGSLNRVHSSQSTDTDAIFANMSIPAPVVVRAFHLAASSTTQDEIPPKDVSRLWRNSHLL